MIQVFEGDGVKPRAVRSGHKVFEPDVYLLADVFLGMAEGGWVTPGVTVEEIDFSAVIPHIDVRVVSEKVDPRTGTITTTRAIHVPQAPEQVVVDPRIFDS